MSECVVYWLHDETCICLQKHGYVGISSTFMRRLGQHQRNKQFPPNFEWSIIFTGSRAECLALEHQLRPISGVGWNRAQGGKPVVDYTPEVREKLSVAAKARKISEETREKLRIVSTGRTNRGRIGQRKSDEERQKISTSLTGKRMPDHVRQKQSERMRGNQNHFGRYHSEETKSIIRTKKQGVPIHSDEHKQKLSERMKGNAFTKGKPWSAARRLAQLARQEK